MKMIIINEGFSNNYGDQLINKSICYLLNRKIDVTYTFQDLNRNIIDGDYSTKRINVKQPTVIFPIRLLFYRFLWLLKNLKRIIKTSIKNDFGVIGGGQLFLNYSMLNTHFLGLVPRVGIVILQNGLSKMLYMERNIL